MLKLDNKKGASMKTVYTIEEVKLQGIKKAVQVWPLTIKQFRRVASVLNTIQNPKEGEEEKLIMDILLEATAIAMETFEPSLSTIEVLEDHVDMPTMDYILNIATGVTVNDPNQKAAQAES